MSRIGYRVAQNLWTDLHAVNLVLLSFIYGRVINSDPSLTALNGITEALRKELDPNWNIKVRASLPYLTYANVSAVSSSL